ncbi:hypothetical protein ACLUWO_08080, partial [Pseudoscardovia radai]|uniref:hypothetical protein n=1 Tax=Pseudoscardovia radai TaxID=987066 RepID=UPI0039920B4B
RTTSSQCETRQPRSATRRILAQNRRKPRKIPRNPHRAPHGTRKFAKKSAKAMFNPRTVAYHVFSDRTARRGVSMTTGKASRRSHGSPDMRIRAAA